MNPTRLLLRPPHLFTLVTAPLTSLVSPPDLTRTTLTERSGEQSGEPWTEEKTIAYHQQEAAKHRGRLMAAGGPVGPYPETHASIWNQSWETWHLEQLALLGAPSPAMRLAAALTPKCLLS